MSWLDRLRGRRALRKLGAQVRRVVESPSAEEFDALWTAVSELRAQQGTAWSGLWVITQLREGDAASLDVLASVVLDERWPLFDRAMGLRHLAKAQHDSVLRIAETYAANGKPLVRSVAAEALAELDDPAAIEPLERLLDDDSQCTDMWAAWRVMDEAARGISRKAHESAACDAWVRARLAELDDEATRADAAISLGHVCHDAAIAPLIEATEEGDLSAPDLLERYRSQEVAKALSDALVRDDQPQRASIAYALGKNGHPSCIDALAHMLAMGSSHERYAAARGLRWLKHDDAARILAKYRDDADPDVRKEARLSP